MRNFLILIIFFSLVIFTGRAKGQTDGARDPSFVIGTGFVNSVLATAIQSDGKILVGGSFTFYNGTPQNRLVRLNTDGSIDTSFKTGTGFNADGDAYVKAIIIQADGKILVGGSFTTYNGTVQNRIARLNTDGSIDTSFNSGSGFGSPGGGFIFINTIAVQPDGKILAGGRFNIYNGKPQSHIARLNADGSLDTSADWRCSQDVDTIVIQSDGKILVGGSFTYTGYFYNQKHIVRLHPNGTLDESFKIGTGFYVSGVARIESIAIQPDGKILVGGYFTTYRDLPQNHIARLNNDGTLDNSFMIGTGFNFPVNTIRILGDGKILIGGGFSTYNETTQNRLVRLHTNGNLDTTFDIGTGFSGILGNIRSISIQADGKYIIGGYFTSFNNSPQNRIIRMSAKALSVTDQRKKELNLYPNPVDETLNFSEEVSDIKIIELSGRMVAQILGVRKSANLPKLPKGLYLVKATYISGEIVTYRIVKK